jgi:undecaprenyl-diphosphatase
MIDLLKSIDLSLFLFLNGIHNTFLDHAMMWATNALIWFPLFIVLLYLTIRNFKWKTILIIFSVALMITASDQLANLSKHSTQRLRPSQDPSLGNSVHIVNGMRGGMYGFYSAHASTTFAVAIFLIVLLRKKYRWVAPVVITWALIMSYTRIYLGLHYPGDTLAGMVIGSSLGLLFGWAVLKLIPCRICSSTQR